jgi:aminoacyl-tRNA hydrolase
LKNQKRFDIIKREILFCEVLMDKNGTVEVLNGTIENVIYRNESNDYTVMEIVNEENDLICAVGIIPMAFEGEKVILVKPQTYMNLSGESVAGFVRKQKIKPENVIVFCDDIDLEKGVCKYREHGSGGTHNGLRNIVLHIGTEFKRIKIGAGNDKSRDLADYVLSRIDDESMEKIIPAIDLACEKLFDIIK